MRTIRLFLPMTLLALAMLACGGGGGGTSPTVQTTPVDFSAADGLATTLTEEIRIGDGASATLNDIGAAHNWIFQGEAGQQVNIQVNGIGQTDPRFKLYSPTGSLLVEADDDAGLDARAQVSLPFSGEYTIRVDVFEGGDYEIILTSP